MRITDHLHWPGNRPRTTGPHKKGRAVEWHDALDDLIRAANEAGWTVGVVTGRAPVDKFGVAVYLNTASGRTVCLTCDLFRRAGANLDAVAKNLRRLTAVLKTGGSGMGGVLSGLLADAPKAPEERWAEDDWLRKAAAGVGRPETPHERAARIEREWRAKMTADAAAAGARADRAAAEEVRRAAEWVRQENEARARRQAAGAGSTGWSGDPPGWSFNFGGFGPGFGFPTGGPRGYAPPPPPPPPADWATVLGVAADAPVELVDKAYRALAKEHHPDRGGDPARMKLINAAYGRFKLLRGLK